MGCKQSADVKPQEKQRSVNELRDPICHFCKKRVPEREYNGHTVQCDEREVTCWHSWCRKIIRQGDLQRHMEVCARQQKTICPKCGISVLVIELQQHRDSCSLVECRHCSERVIGRIVKYCPVQQLGKLDIIVGPFASLQLRHKFGVDVPGGTPTTQLAGVNLGVARMQHLWRWCKTKSVIEEIIFKLIHKEMDLKKEGYAIFKAHDRFAEAHVLMPKRSRSVLQQVVVPSSAEHYFPTDKSPITATHIHKMIRDLCQQVLLPYSAAWRIFTDAMNHLNTLPNVQHLTPLAGARLTNGRWHQGGKIIVVGDLHGQLADLLHILQENGFPSESTFYVFNGDFVDRGQFGVEILLILFSLMITFPKFVALNRGNHECDYMNEEYGFDVEVSTKYDRNVFRLIQRCFCALPLATLIGSKIFVVHGGIPRRKGISLHDIARIQRFRQIPMPEHAQPEEDEIFQDMLWSDPWEQTGWQESERGAGVQFGADVTREFLKTNNLDLVIRSHEEFSKGYEEHHGGLLVTVFSASNYDGPETNSGCFILLSGEVTEPSYHTFNVFEDDFGLWGSPEDGEITAVTTPTSMNMTGTFSKTQTAAAVSFYTGNMLRSTSYIQPVALTKRVRRTRHEVLRVLRERIYQRRHRLLAYFAKLDRTHKGSVWKIEWVETMRNVLNLDLPWFFIRRYIATEDRQHRINYSSFLSSFHNRLMGLWLKEWEQSMAFHISMLQRMMHRNRHLHAAFGKDMVNYNEFCSVMRAIDHSLSDACLFQLFLFFDKDNRGHINGEQFLAEIDHAAPVDRHAIRWDLDTMEQLQSNIIRGRSQLQQLFKITSRDRTITKERFVSGMAMINRGLKRSIQAAQVERIWTFMCRPGEDSLSFEEMLENFSVIDTSRPTRSFIPCRFSRLASEEHVDALSPMTPTAPRASGRYPAAGAGASGEIPIVQESGSASASPNSSPRRPRLLGSSLDDTPQK